MPVYNGEIYIGDAINSILNQTYKNFEFIIIDDASTDRSREIIEEYSKNDNRIIFIKNENNLKIAKTLNKGIRLAKGKFIARMDADDISLPTRLERQIKYLEKHENVFLVGTGFVEIDEQSKEIKKYFTITNSLLLKIRLGQKNPMCHPSIMFRNTGYTYREDVPHCEDYELYLRMLSDGKVISNIWTRLLKYRILKTSITRSNLKEQKEMERKVRNLYHEKSKWNKIDTI